MSQTARYRVLVVGVGSIGERHVRCFQATGRAELALCDVDDTVRESVSERCGVTSKFAALEDALAWQPDAAVICTPAHLHVAQARCLAAQGVSVLIEKPLSTHLEGIAELAGEARAARLVVAVAYVYRAHPLLAAMRQALASGRFGTPVEIVAVCGQHFPTYRPAYRQIYYAHHATGGGAIQDALTHIVNAGEWLVGPVDRLVADAAHQVLPGVEVEDTVHLLTRQGAVLGCYSLNQHQSPNEVTITVVCRRGTLRFEGHRHRWRWMDEPEGPWHDESVEPLARDSLFVRQADAFLDAVANRRAPLCSLEEALQTLRVNLAALDSAQHGAWRVVN